jgi:hypothetical protein
MQALYFFLGSVVVLVGVALLAPASSDAHEELEEELKEAELASIQQTRSSDGSLEQHNVSSAGGRWSAATSARESLDGGGDAFEKSLPGFSSSSGDWALQESMCIQRKHKLKEEQVKLDAELRHRTRSIGIGFMMPMSDAHDQFDASRSSRLHLQNKALKDSIREAKTFEKRLNASIALGRSRQTSQLSQAHYSPSVGPALSAVPEGLSRTPSEEV